MLFTSAEAAWLCAEESSRAEAKAEKHTFQSLQIYVSCSIRWEERRESTVPLVQMLTGAAFRLPGLHDLNNKVCSNFYAHFHQAKNVKLCYVLYKKKQQNVFVASVLQEVGPRSFRFSPGGRGGNSKKHQLLKWCQLTDKVLTQSNQCIALKRKYVCKIRQKP